MALAAALGVGAGCDDGSAALAPDAGAGALDAAALDQGWSAPERADRGAFDAEPDDGAAPLDAGRDADADGEPYDGAVPLDAGRDGDADAGRVDGAPTGDIGTPAPPDAGPSRVLEVVVGGDYTRDELEPFLDPAVHIDHGYSLLRVRFRTDGREAWATVAVPYEVEPPAAGWGVVINNPGTNGVGDPCALGTWVAGAGLAGTFGARGAVGVQVDYPGLGTPGVHPYLVAEVEGRASLDAARAALELGLPVSGAVAIVGVSQGGHATLAAAAQHEAYAPDLDVRAFAAVAPSSVFLEQWRAFPHVAGEHQVFYALLTYAWSQHYGHRGAPVWAEAVADDIDAIMAERCLLTPADDPTLWDVLGDDPAGIFDPVFVDAFRRGDFADYPFMSEGFRSNRLGPYPQTAPLRVYQGDADAVVLEAHTRALVDALRAGGVAVEYEVVPGAGHTDVAFGFVADDEARTDASVAWILEHLGR